MYTEGFEQWIKSTKDFGAPMGELNKATTDICKRMAEENLQLLNENFSLMSDQLKRLSSIKRPEDYLNVLRECINEDISASIENTQRLMHSTMEHMEECAKLWGSVRDQSSRAVDRAEKMVKDTSANVKEKVR